MAITTLSMVLTVFILNLHHISDRPVPNWVKKLVLVYFAKLVGMCDTEKKFSQGESREMDYLLRSRAGVLENINARKANILVTNGKENGNAVIELQSDMNVETGLQSQSCDRPRNEYNEFGDSIGTDRKDNKAELFSKEWRRVAEVFDRLFFWLFLLAIVISTLFLFHPLTDSYLHNNQLDMPR